MRDSAPQFIAYNNTYQYSILMEQMEGKRDAHIIFVSCSGVSPCHGRRKIRRSFCIAHVGHIVVIPFLLLIVLCLEHNIEIIRNCFPDIWIRNIRESFVASTSRVDGIAG